MTQHLTLNPERTIRVNSPTTSSGIKTSVIFFQLAGSMITPVTTEENIDEGSWTTVADFTSLEDGGVDLDELIEHL